MTLPLPSLFFKLQLVRVEYFFLFHAPIITIEENLCQELQIFPKLFNSSQMFKMTLTMMIRACKCAKDNVMEGASPKRVNPGMQRDSVSSTLL